MNLREKISERNKVSIAHIIKDYIKVIANCLSFLASTYVDYTTGLVYTGVSYDSYIASDFINCKDAVKLFVYIGSGGTNAAYYLQGIVFYDNNKNFISGIRPAATYTVSQYGGLYGYLMDIPANAMYVRFNELAANISTKPTTFQIITRKNESSIPDSKELIGKYIANLGDSIFGLYQTDSVSSFITETTGATVYNLGFGGCRAAKTGSTSWDAFSLVAIVDAIISRNFTTQDNAIATDSGLPTYFNSTLATVKSIDFTKVDYVTIGYGTNDFTASVTLENGGDLSDITTLKGALRHSIEALLNSYPHLKIMVLTPTWRFWVTNSVYVNDSDTNVINALKLTDFVQAYKDVAKEYNLPCLDNYYELGINKFNRYRYFHPTDGTHHAIDGRRLLGRKIGHKLITNF